MRMKTITSTARRTMMANAFLKLYVEILQDIVSPYEKLLIDDPTHHTHIQELTSIKQGLQQRLEVFPKYSKRRQEQTDAEIERLNKILDNKIEHDTTTAKLELIDFLLEVFKTIPQDPIASLLFNKGSNLRKMLQNLLAKYYEINPEDYLNRYQVDYAIYKQASQISHEIQASIYTYIGENDLTDYPGFVEEFASGRIDKEKIKATAALQAEALSLSIKFEEQKQPSNWWPWGDSSSAEAAPAASDSKKEEEKLTPAQKRLQNRIQHTDKDEITPDMKTLFASDTESEKEFLDNPQTQETETSSSNETPLEKQETSAPSIFNPFTWFGSNATTTEQPQKTVQTIPAKEKESIELTSIPDDRPATTEIDTSDVVINMDAPEDTQKEVPLNDNTDKTTVQFNTETYAEFLHDDKKWEAGWKKVKNLDMSKEPLAYISNLPSTEEFSDSPVMSDQEDWDPISDKWGSDDDGNTNPVYDSLPALEPITSDDEAESQITARSDAPNIIIPNYPESILKANNPLPTLESSTKNTEDTKKRNSSDSEKKTTPKPTRTEDRRVSTT